MAKKEPEPVKIVKEDCVISEVYWEYPSYYETCGRGYIPGEFPVTHMHLTTAPGDKLIISTKNWQVHGDLRRVHPNFSRPIKLTIEIPTMTDEEVAELEEKEKTKKAVSQLKRDMRALESDTQRKLRDMQKEIEKLEKKYQ
jgi:hypothetical protein